MSGIEGDWNATMDGPCACGYHAVWKITDDGADAITVVEQVRGQDEMWG